MLQGNSSLKGILDLSTLNHSEIHQRNLPLTPEGTNLESQQGHLPPGGRAPLCLNFPVSDLGIERSR